MDIAIRTAGLGKSFVLGNKKTIEVLKNINIEIVKGRLTILKGRSGSGKTTLLNMLSALDEPTAGTVEFLGKELHKLSVVKRENLRSKQMGFVFQSIALVPVMSAYENVDFALRLAEYEGDRDKRIKEVMERVGLRSRMHHMANQLSGGEQQRTALAKVLLTNPKLLLLDEPTKGLDGFFKVQFADILCKLRGQGITIVMVSHDVEFCAEYADMVSMFFDGQILTTDTPHRFFGQNSFYTTAANRMSRCVFQNAVTASDVADLYRKNLE